MALDFICSVEIVRGKKIEIPEGANCNKPKSNKLRFFNANPDLPGNANLHPNGAVSLEFKDYEKHAYNIYYGKPTYYDSKGNILNIVDIL